MRRGAEPPPAALSGDQLIELTAALIEADPGEDADKARAFAKALRECALDAPDASDK